MKDKDMKFDDTPILNTLDQYLSKNPIRMHVPFHGGSSNNDVFPEELYNLDISEVSGYDIEGKDNPIFQSEESTADFFGVKHSFYLTGGASVGLLASMIALNKFGKKVILARNVHKSVVNGVILAGLEPVWLDVDFIEEWGIFSKVKADKLESILSKNKDIAGCVIVSPTYEGVISDVRQIAGICHERNIPLIVDEAHGAHLFFVGVNYDKPLQCADLVIQSWHKSLGSLTQTGVLHLVSNKYFNYKDIKRSLALVSSTSPSFLLLLSLELTRKYLVDTKGAFFNLLLNNVLSLKEEMKKVNLLSVFDNDDPFKIYLKHGNLSGIDFAYSLYKEFSIEVESANEVGFLMTIGKNFNKEIKNKIISALHEISCKGLINQTHKKITDKPKCISMKFNPRRAFMNGFKNMDDIETEIYAPCPPGYIINIPGNKKC